MSVYASKKHSAEEDVESEAGGVSVDNRVNFALVVPSPPGLLRQFLLILLKFETLYWKESQCDKPFGLSYMLRKQINGLENSLVPFTKISWAAKCMDCNLEPIEETLTPTKHHCQQQHSMTMMMLNNQSKKAQARFFFIITCQTRKKRTSFASKQLQYNKTERKVSQQQNKFVFFFVVLISFAVKCLFEYLIKQHIAVFSKFSQAKQFERRKRNLKTLGRGTD